MWARISELFLAFFFFVSPWMLKAPSVFYPILFSCLVVLFSTLSFFPKMGRMHLGNLLIACLLIGIVILEKKTLFYPSSQSFLVFALLLLLFGIIPSKASDYPKSWLEFYEKKRKG